MIVESSNHILISSGQDKFSAEEVTLGPLEVLDMSRTVNQFTK